MFDSQKVKELNELEMIVYTFIIENMEQISGLTIRDLSESCHVSTSTILRCLNKLGYSGYSEFKYALKEYLTQKGQSFEAFYDANVHVDAFLKKVNNESYHIVLDPAIDLILSNKHLVFTGIGTSGTLGTYGARYFSNLQFNSYSITDPFIPVPKRGLDTTLVIALSVSGETVEIIKQIEDFKRFGAQILSITNDQHSTIARLADFNISYYMPEVSGPDPTDEAINLTTQVPVVALLEILAQQAYQRENNAKD
ncbi:MurR/RpiR family transcriptional regulator [Enterococcus pseudoavium]|uniref:MurR/RpiR family transcriptional regulator n=1 Tax=Enterococcus pseudoavium TaxID=44007 RepID=A0AAE4L2X3_9ENTE|nr:MurR/RpiR family transcriptional regulator [Enterococcus pseudoavium]MDT2737283.1 MurR/RpiR family transcriptional regulator [Enterococcus pseudoavium]MDT2755667.1 MurR/RpiR family transcriptional regulator [Enterococcus pseudoavium]MDT2771627.1 MurR/RpiR family transcriptional regulator [Enterococcus pseudoavium]REC33034.1 MurR/RpiR family transcriptional regulator [Enterococcus pseudoavium]